MEMNMKRHWLLNEEFGGRCIQIQVSNQIAGEIVEGIMKRIWPVFVMFDEVDYWRGLVKKALNMLATIQWCARYLAVALIRIMGWARVDVSVMEREFTNGVE